MLLPTYENISEEDKLKITNFLKDCKEGKGKLFSLDINVKDETLGDKWIKEIILIDKYNLSKDIVNIIEFNYDITKDKKSENELCCSASCIDKIWLFLFVIFLWLLCKMDSSDHQSLTLFIVERPLLPIQSNPEE